jgi:HAD superfamily hydrolase (TIGR01549 family)
MIGVAFALDGTLAVSPGLEEAASAALHEETAGRRVSRAADNARFRQIAAGMVPRYLQPLPGALRVLKELQSLSVPVVIYSKGQSTIEDSKAAALDFSGHLLVSEDVGFAPPEPGAFAAIARELALPAERIWYVSHDAKDVAAAEAVGMHGVHVTGQVDDVLETLREPYTRSLLGLRYIMRTALEWRAGHVVTPEDIEES